MSKSQIGPDTWIVATDLQEHPWWARQSWRDCRISDATSISKTAQILREPGVVWAHSSFNWHRRSELILEKLPRWRLTPKNQRFGLFQLLSPQKILYSKNIYPQISQFSPSILDRRNYPSRAYQKLDEVFKYHWRAPNTTERCLELGASPGGWTALLQEHSSHIVAVDRAPLSQNFTWKKTVSFKKGNAFSVELQDFDRFDWLFSDLICEPQKLLELINRWISDAKVERIVATVKFKGATDVNSMNQFLSIPGSRATHLFHNKHEVTWLYKLAHLLD